MDYLGNIMRTIKYIEDHLDGKLSNKECGQVCGYSEYHFIRIFTGVTGVKPSTYIRKRRLTKAAKLINQTDKTILEVALEVGFNSQENFNRAFKTEHGVTPTGYRKTHNSLKLTGPFSAERDHQFKEPKMIIMPEEVLWAFRFETDYDNRMRDIPTFWNQYYTKKLHKVFDDHFDPKDRVDVGKASFDGDRCSYFIGSKIQDPSFNQSEMTKIILPKQKYAVFQTPSADAFTFVENIHKTWNYIYNEWLPKQKLQPGEGHYEAYCEESRTYSEAIYFAVDE